MKSNFEKDNLSGTNHEGANANWPVKYLTSSSVIGDKIENPSGEHLGEIKDLMLDIHKGEIEYVVIEFGGFMGFGERLFAIPFEALSINQSKRAFILDKDKKYFEKAPGFDKNHWPETNAHLNEVNNYWGSFMGNNTGGM